MTDHHGLDALYMALLLVLPISALVARRIPIGHAAKMAIAWIAIFALGFVVISARHRFASWWYAAVDMIGGSDQASSGGTLRVQMADDGHFWVWAQVDGVRRRMLIDSGATTTAISSATASAAKLDLDESPFKTMLDTANGPVMAQRSSIDTLTIGPITMHGMSAVVSPSFGDTDVLGMNFLSRLKGWRVEGGVLILEPDAPR